MRFVGPAVISGDGPGARAERNFRGEDFSLLATRYLLAHGTLILKEREKMEPEDKAIQAVDRLSRAATLFLVVCILFVLLLLGMGFYGSYIAGRIRGIHEGYEYGQAACN